MRVVMLSGLRPVCQSKYVHVAESSLAFCERNSLICINITLLQGYTAEIVP